MSKFERDFPFLQVPEVLEASPWFGDLLRLWQPAGGSIPEGCGEEAAKAGSGVTNLRLAVRHGYLNFYQAGQSVARVSFSSSGKLQAKIHEKYVYGTEASGQKYVALTSDGYLDLHGTRRPYAGSQDVAIWIENAKHFGGDEKAFVERVVSRNENVIDLEMGLPAYLDDASKKVAPRIDLVALERGASSWKIVLWEAKLVTDARARCRGDIEPEVCRQLKSYTDWFDHGDHSEAVTNAYTNACKVLVGMHEIAQSLNPSIRPLGEAIAAIASGSEKLTIEHKPRLLIDNRIEDMSFADNGHLEKLRALGHHVQVVGKDGDMRLEPAA